jgi:hypothetical protein
MSLSRRIGHGAFLRKTVRTSSCYDLVLTLALSLLTEDELLNRLTTTTVNVIPPVLVTSHEEHLRDKVVGGEVESLVVKYFRKERQALWLPQKGDCYVKKTCQYMDRLRKYRVKTLM